MHGRATELVSWAGLLLGLTWVPACTGGDSGTKVPAVSAGGAAAASGGASATGGNANTGGSPAFGPAITEAPAEWVRPADCGGVGNLCPNLSGCVAEMSFCQALGNVCIPATRMGGSLPGRSSERPYCAAYTCMTFSEASCFCTGEAAQTESGCMSPAALAGLCAAENKECTLTSCCDGLQCLPRRNGSTKACRKPCASETDCASLCCTDSLDTGVKVCSAPAECETQCKKRGEACQTDPDTGENGCCRGTCVQSENSAFSGCRPTCSQDQDCDTGCCQLFSNSSKGFCVDALYCTCGAAGAPCGGFENPNCCAGTHCTGDSVTTLTCNTECTEHSDCAPGCCVPVSEAGYKVCQMAQTCF